MKERIIQPIPTKEELDKTKTLFKITKENLQKVYRLASDLIEDRSPNLPFSNIARKTDEVKQKRLKELLK